MLASISDRINQTGLSEFECGISDEQKRKDIAEEEFEVSSSYSPMDSYSPKFLKIEETLGKQ